MAYPLMMPEHGAPLLPLLNLLGIQMMLVVLHPSLHEAAACGCGLLALMVLLSSGHPLLGCGVLL
jgi:hypothetical protein